MNNKPLLLAIMDGYGLNPETSGNAIAAANKPNLDKLFATCSHSTILCSGMDVGLPEGQMGNSEVGHTNIGAGRVVYQELTRITKSILDGDFFVNPTFVSALEAVKKSGKKLHLMGLLSNGGVHSHNTHLYALVELAKKMGIADVMIHCFLDGRDVSPNSAKEFVQQLEDKLTEIGTGKIATVIGRYYAMDRDNRWERVQKAYDAMVLGIGVEHTSAVQAVQQSYDDGVLDEFVLPTVLCRDGRIGADDAVIFFNFRPDRAREITRTFVDEAFDGFSRANGFIPVHFVCITQYDASMPNVKVAFAPQSLANTFGEYISQKGLTQLRIAETEKYAHVTFFFNGGVEAVYSGEDRDLISSPKVATYDMMPEMSAIAVTDEVVKKIEANLYDVIIMNYANCDMVGHTGDMKAAIQSVEVVDACIGRVAEAVTKQGGVMLITADHGNADQMVDYNSGGAFTAHTTNAVPLILVGLAQPLKDGRLADIAPTMLDILGLDKPFEMTGASLLNK